MSSTNTSHEIDAEAIAQTCRILKERTSVRPVAAIILGSGLGGLSSEVNSELTVSYADLPGLPTPRASGHAGKLILGLLGGLPVMVFAGRSHLYEGHSAETTTASVRVAVGMGAKLCIASNAAGGINPRFVTGDLVAIDSHINLFYSPVAIASGKYEPMLEMGNAVRTDTPLYDPELIGQCCELAMGLGFALHRGTYLGTSGPTYETRAEYRAFRTMGADMVGMSTILEMLAASQAGMRTLAFSVITNVANPDRPAKTTHEEVLDVAAVAQERLLPLVVELLSKLNIGL